MLVQPLGGKKKKKETNKKPQKFISIMAVLILQTEDDVLTEHCNDSSVPNILWLK